MRSALGRGHKMAYLRFAVEGKTRVKVFKGGECVAWLRKGVQWTLCRLEGTLSMDELALVRQYALERS
jgi:hypothetical protein